MAFQHSPETIDLWRFIASIGLGVELVNVDAYVSELVPKEQRGPAFAYNQFIMYTAVPVVAFLAWQLVPQTIFGPRRLARGRHHRLDRRGRDLVDPPQSAGIAALAGAARPHRRSRGASSRTWSAASAPKPARELPPPETVAGESRQQNRRLDGDVEFDLSRPHHHAGDLQSVPDDRLLRVFQLGADALDLAGHRRHQVARLYFHYRGGGAARPADRRLLRRPFRAQMADRLGRASASPCSAFCSPSRPPRLA